MKAYFTTFLVTLASLLAIALARNECEDPLSCYLNSIVIEIPDTCLPVKDKDLCIRNFVCNGIYLSAVPSEYEAPTTLNMGAVGLGTNCEGKYFYGPIIHGTVTALINATDFDVGLLIGKEGELPVSASFSHCELTSMNVEISLTDEGLDDLTPIMEKMIERAVDVLLCTDIPNFLEVNVTSAIVNVLDPKLQALIASQPSALPVYNSHYTAWGDSIISKIKKILDLVEGAADVKDFLLCMLTPSSGADLQHAMVKELQALFLSQPGAERASEGESYQEETPYGSYRVGVPADTVIVQKANFPPGYDSTITLTSLQIRGLDTVTDLDILEPIPSSNTTLRTVLGFGDLTVELGLEVDVVPSGTSGRPGRAQVKDKERYTERLKVTLELKDTSFLMDLVLAVNAFVLKSYYLDQLSTSACWLSAMEEVSIANLQLHTTVAQLVGVQVAGSAGALEADILALIDNAVLLLVSPEGFGQLTSDVLNGLMQGPVRAQFNDRAAQLLAEAHKNSPCLTHYPYNDHADYVVWANSTLVNTLDFIVNDLLGYQGINKLMTCATNGTGELALNTSRLSVSLGGLNSFYAFKLLSPVSYILGDPVKPYQLETLVSLGFCPFLSSPNCNPFELLMSYNPEPSALTASTSTSKLTAAFAQAIAAFDLSLRFSNFSAYLSTEMKIDKDGLRDTTYSQLGTLGCLGSSFSAIVIENVSLTVADAHISIDDGQMQRNITFLIDKVLSAITRDDKIQERNNQIAYDLSVAEETCLAGGVAPAVVVSDDGSDKASMDWQWELFILVVGCLSSLVMLLAAYNYWGRAGKNMCTPEFVFQECEEESPDMPFWTRMYYRWDCKNSLLFHTQIPLWLQVAVPVCILGTVVMFLMSNVDPQAVSVMVQVVIGTKVIDVGSVFDFGLKSTVVDMWNAKVYPLSVLILFFSGAWPYVKLLSMLLAWVAPPKLVSIERRESILTVLDVLGKWSLIDFFVMILMLCAFYFNIYIGTEIAVNVTVLPKWGFYGFLLATMISLGLGHIILACHRLVVEPKVLAIPEEYCPKESLSSITYEITLSDRDVRNLCATGSVSSQAPAPAPLVAGTEGPVRMVLEEGDAAAPQDVPVVNEAAAASDGITTPVSTETPNAELHKKRGTTMLVKVLPAGKALVVVLLVLTALFVVAGTFMLTMQFEFKGLVGLMLKDAADVDYSFVSVGTSIPEHSGVPNDFSTRWLQASLFLFGQAMPFALLLVVLILWVQPMTLASQRQLFVLAEVLNAWSALDVFCIAIAAALLEIQQFAAFIVGDSCDSINVILAEYMDTALDGDDKCFDVVAQLDKNSWILFMAAALLIVVVLPLLNICSAAIHLRLKLTEQASVLMHHLSHGTANASVREALRSLSKEQQYGGELFAKEAHLAHPLLPEGAEESKAAPDADADPALFKSLAPTAPGDSTSPETSVKSSPNSAEGNGSPALSGDSNGAESAVEKESWWSLMTMHNFTLTSVRAFAACRLVRVSYIPSRPADQEALQCASDSLAFYQN